MPAGGTVRHVTFAALAALIAAATLWSALTGTPPVRIVLLGSLAGYAAVLAIPTVDRRAERLAALPLGVLGVGASLVGAPTDLPVLFVLLGVGSLVDLVWDPTGVISAE